MDYAVVKLVHQSAVALSIAGFFVRGAASLAGADWVRGAAQRRRCPTSSTPCCCVSAVTHRMDAPPGAGEAPWLLAKIVGLVVYVGLGVVALRPGRSRAVRASAWLARSRWWRGSCRWR
jgi:uncharacterized membrane protein SirB2